jgi:hypothetical protein
MILRTDNRISNLARTLVLLFGVCAFLGAPGIVPGGTLYALDPAPVTEGKPSFDAMEYDSIFFSKKVDPIFAGMLSWYMPGLGQYYATEYVKGTVFLVTEYTLVFAAIFYYLDFDFAAGTGSGFHLKVDAKRTNLGVVETSRRNVFFGLIGCAVALHLYDVYDAVMSARSYNTRLEKSRQQYHELYPKLNFGFNGTSLLLGVERAL